ncbi:hypothetical protein SEA_PITADOG_40 [Arthrobacter phage PitaDog]|uniref:Uncharacterized protein n=1 Tax=Arthrobacter phage PitaDog TaxID=2015866 RepID=A0A222ZGK6_9CAUD|nr:hypothetical protein SEA_PITADOG_40 [Arthrobacter phage PitaDog]
MKSLEAISTAAGTLRIKRTQNPVFAPATTNGIPK